MSSKTSKKNSTAKNKIAKPKSNLALVLWLSIGIPVGLIFIFSILTGWTQYGMAYLGCNLKQPVIVTPGSSFAGGVRPSYVLPGYPSNPFYKPSLNSVYYCSEEAASEHAEIDSFFNTWRNNPDLWYMND